MGKYQLAYARPVGHMFAPSQQCLHVIHAHSSGLSHTAGDYRMSESFLIRNKYSFAVVLLSTYVLSKTCCQRFCTKYPASSVHTKNNIQNNGKTQNYRFKAGPK
jgi:hypothetical protein